MIDKLTTVQNFYQNELVPTLRSTIDAQAENIKELLKTMPWAKGGD